jgi:RNA ligase (TIGR02306 family)
MSAHICEVVPVILEKHDNADSLSIAKVKGWQCVVKTEDFKNVKLGIYIPLDMVVPDTEEWKWLSDRRIKTHKFRGALSQGILIPAKEGMKFGDDVTNKLGVVRYVPKIPGNKSKLRGGYQIPAPEGLEKYTDIENYKNYVNVFTGDDIVVITEKIHGANARFSLINGKFYVGSHNTVRKPIPDEPATSLGKLFIKILRKLKLVHPRRFPDTFQLVAEKYNIESKMRGNFKPYDKVTIYGEIYGPQVQKFDYGVPQGETHVRFFDIMVNGKYLPWDKAQGKFVWMGLETVPQLGIRQFGKEIFKMVDGPAFAGKHVREGIVIRPYKTEEFHPKLGRKILKIISDKYLLKDIEDNPDE